MGTQRSVYSLQRGLLVIGLLVGFGLARSAAAQNLTTGTLSGQVTDEQGAVLPGADITATHVPTGTVYSAVSQGDGSFIIPAVRVGGPYTVIAKMAGFNDQKVDEVTVSLGESKAVNFKMTLATVTEQVEVRAQANPIFSSTRTGTAANVSSQTIQNMPTVSRTIEDFARLSPHFTPTPVNNTGSAPLSVAGKNSRYNNFQIDGAANSDLFGLSDSATPGGQTNTQPISLDAISEIQLVVAPYDVRQGGFSGGGINAVTRSGSNEFHGDGYYYFLNQNLTGDDPQDRQIAKYRTQQGGVSVGGPVVRNRAFFFSNLDINRVENPTGFSADGSSGTMFPGGADAARVRQILMDAYGYNPGGLDEFVRESPNNKWFGRGDINLGARHQLTIRHNYIDASADIGTESNTQWLFPDFIYNIANSTNSTVGELNSTFGGLFNTLRVTYQRVRDNRGGPTRFPAITVHTGPSGSTLIKAGTENFSTANQLDQDVVEITDDLTMVKGKHTFTFGTHNELFKFRNLFIRDNYGTYEFSSVDALAAGVAQGFDYSFSTTGDPQQSARFNVNQLGFYAGDQWRLANNFTLQYGLRVDVPLFPDKPTRNPASEQFFGYRTDEVPGGAMWSPRVGFNWNLGGERRQQLRGGIGIFNGRTPYVWLSNQYGNTGIEFTRLRVFYPTNPGVPFIPNPDAQPTSIGQAATNEIDLIDPDYKFPSALRWNVAYDRDLGVLGLVATGEVLFSETLKDIDYRNLNFAPTGETRPDGRPVLGRVVSSLSDVIFLTNTDQGRSWSASGRLERPFRNGLYLSAAYLYGRATSVSDGTSSQAASNWGNVYAVNPNAADLARANFEVRHRLVIGGSYTFNLPARVTATAGLYYNGQSGRPYVVNFFGDANGDTRTGNDLIYVPRSADEVIVRNGTWADLDNFINNDASLRDYRGTFAPRNAGLMPWMHNVDFHLAVGVPAGRLKPEIVLDVLNLGNLLNDDWGLQQYTSYGQVTTAIAYGGIDPATGKEIYDISGLTRSGFQTFSRDDLRSRWRAQLGLRLAF